MMKSFSLTILSLSLFSMAHATSIEQYSLSNASSKPIAVIAPTTPVVTTTAVTTPAKTNEAALQSEIEQLKERLKQQDNKIKQLNQAIQNNPTTSKTVATGPAANQPRTTTVNSTTTTKTTVNSTTTDKKTTTANTNTTAKVNTSTTTATNNKTPTNTITPNKSATAKIASNTTPSTAKATTATKVTTPVPVTHNTPAKANTPTAKPVSTTATKTNAVSDKTAYEAASKVYQQEGAAKAIAPMQEFIKNYPNSPLLPNAHFWLGEFNLSLTPPRILTAKTNFKAVVDKYPKSTLAPSALARLVEISQNIDKDPVQAEIYQKQLLQKYPESKEAQREKKINQ